MYVQETLPHDQKRTALANVPTFLEVMGHSYFFGGFLVGPQFPMKRYLDFTQGHFFHGKTVKPPCIVPALSRLALGMGCLLFSLIGSGYLDEKFLLSDEFVTHGPAMRLILMGMWQVVTLHKYVACWLLSEGSCIMAGLTYNGRDENGNDLWNGCVNISVWRYEMATTFDDLIKSFNINTNLWVAQCREQIAAADREGLMTAAAVIQPTGDASQSSGSQPTKFSVFNAQSLEEFLDRLETLLSGECEVLAALHQILWILGGLFKTVFITEFFSIDAKRHLKQELELWT
ncbi:hypothetical protein HPB52_001186 [Rhipicephalus sanguineus]|uniref:Lysophospholipid acyltransferase 5 n=1 Tax=Rhipicephalus sanguineus TaxID=34632 RepID=A0A9D4PTT3_RHISA|nr:hypothetical protein HPB52_001186 [Rhipicephalus sanguineus]